MPDIKSSVWNACHAERSDTFATVARMMSSMPPVSVIEAWMVSSSASSMACSTSCVCLEMVRTPGNIALLTSLRSRLQDG